MTVSHDRQPVVVSDLDEGSSATSTPAGPGRYVLEGAGDREYLACEGCGALESVDPAALEGVRDAVRELSGFEARFSHFPIVGLCADCAKERRRPVAPGGGR